MEADDSRIKKIKVEDIQTDPVGDMLVSGDALKPYMLHYAAVMTGQDSDSTLQTIAALPIEKRYLFRVAQCLDWALADYDGETAKLDLPYIPNLEELTKKLQMRELKLLSQTRQSKSSICRVIH